MRPVTINPATGADTTVDPRVAPQGALARVENMRVDKQGRLILRNGYQSLGVTTNIASNLVPFDLSAFGSSLVVLGNIASGGGGIRLLFQLAQSPIGVWRTGSASAASVLNIAAADAVSIAASSPKANVADVLTADSAMSANGLYTAALVSDGQTTSRVTVYDTGTKAVTFDDSVVGANGRILAIGNVFYVFVQVAAAINVFTFDATSNTLLTGPTGVAAGASALPAAYDVAVYAGTTDYLLAFPTATGYTWIRYNSAHALQTTTNVVSLADAPVSIAGSTGENVSVANVRAASGVELRTFTFATGVLAVGPTNVDTTGFTFVWVSLARISSTQVHVLYHRDATSLVTSSTLATIAAHALTQMNGLESARPVSRQVFVDGRIFVWCALGLASSRPYGLFALTTLNSTAFTVLSAVALDGAAKTSFSTATAGYKTSISGVAPHYVTTLISFDPRDKSYRSQLVTFDLFSGERRQTTAMANGVLAIAGGVTAQYDGVATVEIGFETRPQIVSTVQSTGAGLLTLLGVYQYLVIFRSVSKDGQVTQSGPSDIATITLTGANNQVVVGFTTTFSMRAGQAALLANLSVFADVYRTEAGGSIPRLVGSTEIRLVQPPGKPATFSDLASDVAQQTGAVVYTQGADGAVSGRLPLGLAAPSRYVAESGGRLLLGGLERADQLEMSVEGRPGEAVGFSGDDLFFAQSPDALTSVVSGVAGRRYLFSRTRIRELIGDGPNAAGVGDISEPLEIETRVGCKDWRSVVKTEFGIMFQANDDKLYLLPEGGAGALEISTGIREVLRAFPVITSATRHENDQLVTFTLKDAALTDGRIVHLDLQTSGMGKAGWTGRWIVDRVAALEGASFPEIIEERLEQTLVIGTGTVSIDLPRGSRINDQSIVVITIECAAAGGSLSTPGAYTLRATNAGGTTQQSIVVQRQLPNTTSTLISVAFSAVLTPTVITIKQWLIRGAATVAIEATTFSLVAPATSWALPTLTPSWGSLKTLWLACATSDAAFSDVSNPVIKTSPAGFGAITRIAQRDALNTAATSCESEYASQKLETAALSGAAFTTTFTTINGIAWLIGVRPLAATGTPVRSSAEYQGDLVVCTATDVRRVTAGSFVDGSTPIKGEWESGDIAPMGPNGAGRHLAINVTGELLGSTQLYAALSYDGGNNWTDQRQFQLTPTNGFYVGQVLTLQWAPKRRKVNRVRLRLVQGDESGAGATAGFALNQVTLFFEDLIGPARATNAAGVGGSRK